MKYMNVGSKYDMDVAPCAGAWIEIFGAARTLGGGIVAPCAGAWIEMRLLWLALPLQLWSPPARGRGLKCA